jgi:hypothetical protein
MALGLGCGEGLRFVLIIDSEKQVAEPPAPHELKLLGNLSRSET